MTKSNMTRLLFGCAIKFCTLGDYPNARGMAKELGRSTGEDGWMGMMIDEETTDHEILSWLCRNEPSKLSSDDWEIIL